MRPLSELPCAFPALYVGLLFVMRFTAHNDAGMFVTTPFLRSSVAPISDATQCFHLSMVVMRRGTEPLELADFQSDFDAVPEAGEWGCLHPGGE